MQPFTDSVRNRGPVTTYGVNDMVLDNWGVVDRWVAEEKITSHGQSGIGFVNFGTVNVLQVEAPIETFGQGARGFNVYTGTVNSAEFERIVTHADGAVGVQISQPVGKIKVRRGIETFGGAGNSLVKGVVVKLSAIALSLKPGGSAREISIAGGLITHGEGVSPLEVHGAIESLQVTDGFAAAGGGFEKISWKASAYLRVLWAWVPDSTRLPPPHRSMQGPKRKRSPSIGSAMETRCPRCFMRSWIDLAHRCLWWRTISARGAPTAGRCSFRRTSSRLR
jgi:hypothetical protein